MSSDKPRGPKGVRLQKAISNAGVTSRRKAEDLIRAAKVSVNGKVVTELGTRVGPEDVIRVEGQKVDRGRNPRYILLNKPTGVVCTTSDPQGRKVITDCIPSRYKGVYPVGRLDYNSEGAMLLTDDGELANRLAHPRYGVEKVYAVKVRGVIEQQDARLKQIQDGITLEDGVAEVQRLKVHRATGKNTWLEFTLSEGRNREIRRICDAVEIEVVRLQRRSFGPIDIVGLPTGKWRELTKQEIRKLKKSVAD